MSFIHHFTVFFINSKISKRFKIPEVEKLQPILRNFSEHYSLFNCTENCTCGKLLNVRNDIHEKE